MMVGIYRTHEALEAAWKYFILGSVGIALALFGTILVYLAAVRSSVRAWARWPGQRCCRHAPAFDPSLLNIAFIFLLLGYGTKVGLAPMHAWLPDAHAEGPTPVSAVLSGLLLNVALYALLRFKMMIAANSGAIAVGPLLITLGLVSLIFAAFMLYRRRDIKRMFAYSSIEHMGIIVFAFGMGGPLGNFAGLLQMVMHSLTKSAIFFTVGHVAQVKGTQRIAEIRGLTTAIRVLGWTLVAGSWQLPGLPPFGIFTSEFLSHHVHFRPGAGAGCHRRDRVAGGFRRAAVPDEPPAFGEPTGAMPRCGPPMCRSSFISLCSGGGAVFAERDGRLVSECRGAAEMIAEGPTLDPMALPGWAVAGHWPWPRLAVSPEVWAEAAERLGNGALVLLGLWGDFGAVHMAIADAVDPARILVLSLHCPEEPTPPLGALIRRRSGWSEPHGSFGTSAIGLPDSRPWLDHGLWTSRPRLRPTSSSR